MKELNNLLTNLTTSVKKIIQNNNVFKMRFLQWVTATYHSKHSNELKSTVLFTSDRFNHFEFKLIKKIGSAKSYGDFLNITSVCDSNCSAGFTGNAYYVNLVILKRLLVTMPVTYVKIHFLIQIKQNSCHFRTVISK